MNKYLSNAISEKKIQIIEKILLENYEESVNEIDYIFWNKIDFKKKK